MQLLPEDLKCCYLSCHHVQVCLVPLASSSGTVLLHLEFWLDRDGQWADTERAGLKKLATQVHPVLQLPSNVQHVPAGRRATCAVVKLLGSWMSEFARVGSHCLPPQVSTCHLPVYAGMASGKGSCYLSHMPARHSNHNSLQLWHTVTHRLQSA
jgi:hypothetical protein